MLRSVYAVACRPRSIPRLARRRWSIWRARVALAQGRRLVPAILVELPGEAGLTTPTTWQIHHAEWTGTGVAVFAVGAPWAAPTAVIKLPSTREGNASLQRQRAVQATLYADARLGHMRALLPEPLAEGAIGKQAYIVERALPGCSARALLADPTAHEAIQRAAVTMITELHRQTTRSVIVDNALLERWIDQPLSVLRAVLATYPPDASAMAGLARLRQQLYAALAGQKLQLSWIHGDFWLGNVLVRPESLRLSGLVDWDRAAPDELALHDLMHLLLVSRRLVRDHGPADVLAALRDGVGWTPHERALLAETGLQAGAGNLGTRGTMMLYWLRQTAATLTLLPRWGRDQDYVADNISGVLRHI